MMLRLDFLAALALAALIVWAYLRRRRRWLKPRLVGMAYELQKVAALPHAGWDIPLEGIVTEAECYAGGVPRAG